MIRRSAAARSCETRRCSGCSRAPPRRCARRACARVRVLRCTSDAAPSPMTNPSRIEIERPAGFGRIAGPLAHRLDDGERAKGERTQRRFGAAGDDHVREIVADVTQRFADRDGAAGATVRVRRADAAKPELDRDVRMRRAAKDLQARAFDSRRAFLSSESACADLRRSRCHRARCRN